MTAQILVEKKKLAKPPLELHYLGDRVLRQPAKRITKIDNEIRQLARDMLQTMYSNDGIGLAAPQVGVNKQLLVVDIELDDPAKPPLIMINPTIVRASQEQCVIQEGCLSIPGVFLDVTRPDEIEVSYKDENGRPQKLVATDLLARVIQHEMDHLNGVMFVDRVDNALALNQELDKHGFSMQAVKPVEE
ncbi:MULTISPECIES: peptide deformylase [unclassified Leptolyngbya]|uniref:peptide deformylase n=1 Tax=unclassified Leptolyngbya TaxID=2650499 RepID=UPI0016831D55|nr:MULTISPECIES: peptide deformylase [unclassified Leptolyngbya]MBD1912482.1 peptide deformylase [Leptolyngbya sp. FACHB-8]MBD2156507.1 peptide deformylase [Leptolyngbya sp. FACHB-16]